MAMANGKRNHSESQESTGTNEVREDRRLKGKILRINEGFGFIEGENGIDYFFHWTELTRFSKKFSYLKQGDLVEFQPGRTDSGPRAFQILATE
jgi:cold shock CspA family protein